MRRPGRTVPVRYEVPGYQLDDALDRSDDRRRVEGDVDAAAKQALVDAGFLKVDYVALVDADTLEPRTEPAGEMRLIAAATIGSTRLIDNVRVISDTVGETGSPPR